MAAANPFAIYLQQMAKQPSGTENFGTTETAMPGGVTVTGAPPTQGSSAPPAQGSASYLADPDAWIAQNYGSGYSQDSGVTTVGSGNGITMTHKKMTPETHPWAFINPDEVDVNGRIYGDGATRTGTGYQAGRQATDAERQASYDANNYFKNGGEGLNPALLEAMTRYITPGQAPGNQYSNQFGTYTQQHKIVDQARARLGLDPWVEVRSSFSGVDQQGNPVNYQNQRSDFGDGGVRNKFPEGDPRNADAGGWSHPNGPAYNTNTPTGELNRPNPGGAQTPRSWSNVSPFLDRSTLPGDNGEQTVASNPAMAALKAAMMGGWGS